VSQMQVNTRWWQVLAFAVTLAALVMAPTAAADKPTRVVYPSPADFVIDDECTFPVLVHTPPGTEVYTFFDQKHGSIFKIFGAGGGKQTLTNMNTGASVTVTEAGSLNITNRSDGSGFFHETGRSLSVVGSPLTGEPGIFVQNGDFLATWDAAGETSFKLTGSLVDLCSELAP